MTKTTKTPDLHKQGVLTLAVVSDLHAYDDPDSPDSRRPSHLCCKSSEAEPGQHPITGLLKLIEDDTLRADMLLIGGDLGDKARPAAIEYAWRKIIELGKALAVTRVAATTGNHDVDSRYKYTKFDAKGMLQRLKPPFPLIDEPLCDRFWARNYAVIAQPHYRLVVLNSSAFHGAAPDELNHGRISEHTLACLKEDLEAGPSPPVNILLCHHHPQQHMELQLNDYDVMKNGQLILDLIGSGKLGRWLVIHGHKHHPKITYASGGATAPTVFSAGSLSVELYLELQSRARNQFYIVTLPFDTFGTMGFVGKINAWDWASGKGWVKAQSASGLPWTSGFGCRADVAVLAANMASTITTFASWEDLIKSYPEVDFLLPNDLMLLIESIEGLGLKVMNDSDGRPVQIGRAP